MATSKGKHIKKNSKEKGFFSFLKSPDRHRKISRNESGIEVDAEKLTAEEAMSRLLHTPNSKANLPNTGPIFDHFVVVGANQSEDPSPKILYSYPGTAPPNYPGLEDFCFPESVRTSPVALSPCNSELLELTHNQQFHKPDNQFVFLFTDNEGRVFYGICIHKKELLEDSPLCVNQPQVETEVHKSTIRCYCLVSKFPFFRLHFDFLLALFSVDHLFRLEQQQPTIEDDEELNVFLGVSSKKIRGTCCSPDKTKSKSSDTAKPPTQAKEEKKELSVTATHIRSASYKDYTRNLRSKSPKVDTTIFNDSPPLSPKMNIRPKSLMEGQISRRAKSNGDEIEINSPVHTPKQDKKKHQQLQVMPKPIEIVTSSDTALNPCLVALQRYYTVPIPKKGQDMEFTVSQYLNPITFTRPFFDEEEELYAEWGLPLTFYQLSFKTLTMLLSAILLERRVLVYCKNLRFLSALVLSLPPLLRPFMYQSVMIPMLPQSLPNLLEAPVPYVIGVTQMPENVNIPDDVIVFNVQKDSYKSSTPIPMLPKFKELYPFFLFPFFFLFLRHLIIFSLIYCFFLLRRN